MRRLIVILLALVLVCNEQVSAQESVSTRQRVCLETTEGNIVLELYNETPLHHFFTQKQKIDANANDFHDEMGGLCLSTFSTIIENEMPQNL